MPRKAWELVAALAITTFIVVLTILTAPNHVGRALTFVFTLATVVLACIAFARQFSLPHLVSNISNHPLWLAIPLIAAFSFATYWLYEEHTQQVAEKLTGPEEGKPWREELVARVYWNKPPSQGMREGFADTVRLLGFNYEEVDSAELANLRIWTESWQYYCKWPTTMGFASLDPNPGSRGSQTGIIHICRFRTPIKFRPITDYSVVAHETAHLFAAQVHVGNGLMGIGGGDGSPWFNKMEIEAMCKNINDLHDSVKAESDDSSGKLVLGNSEDADANPPCGSDELHPKTRNSKVLQGSDAVLPQRTEQGVLRHRTPSP